MKPISIAMTAKYISTINSMRVNIFFAFLFSSTVSLFLANSPATAQPLLSAQDIRLLCSGLGSQLATDDNAEFSLDNGRLRAKAGEGGLIVYEGDMLVLELNDFNYGQYTSCLSALVYGNPITTENPEITAVWRASPPVPMPQRGFDNSCPCVAIFQSPDELLIEKPSGYVAVRNDCGKNSSVLGIRDAGQRIENPNFSAIPSLPSLGSGPNVTSSHIYERQEYAYILLEPGQVGYVDVNPTDYSAKVVFGPFFCGS